MKFTNEKYRFALPIEEGNYDKVENLIPLLEILKMNDIRNYQRQYFCTSFKEEVQNNYSKIEELFTDSFICSGCEITSGGFGYYYNINPDLPDGLRVIAIKSLNNSEAAGVLEKMSLIAREKIFDLNLLQTVLNDIKRPKVVFAAQSVNFSKHISEYKESGLVRLEMDLYNPGKYIEDNPPEHIKNDIAQKFYSWIFIELFKKYVKTEIQIIGDSSGHKKYFGDIKMFSDFPIRVFQYDRSYWREIIRSYPFPVREHEVTVWCGKGRKDKKIVKRRAHTRKGYHRKPGKDL